jgi:hypothetical protein
MLCDVGRLPAELARGVKGAPDMAEAMALIDYLTQPTIFWQIWICFALIYLIAGGCVYRKPFPS